MEGLEIRPRSVRRARIHPRFKQEPYWNTIIATDHRTRVAEMINAGRVASRVEGFTGNVPDVIMGEMLRSAVHPEGGIDAISLPSRRDGRGPIVREMINTSQGQMALLEKVKIDVAFGLAEIPLLYGPIYRRIAPAGGFPGGVFQVDDFTLQADVVFLEKFEGGEVEFGTLRKGSPSTGVIKTYAAGFEWTEDMIEFDRTWQIEENNRAFGRAANALLNHLHLGPIIGYAYGADNQTAYDASGSTVQEEVHLTLQNAYKTTILPPTGPRRTGSVILASESDRFTLEEALLTPVLDADGNALVNVPVQTIIYYDGETITVGGSVYTYPGVTPGKCYLIFPQRKMVELVHHDLKIDIGPPDISRLVEGQQVGRMRRNVYANILESVEEVDISA